MNELAALRFEREGDLVVAIVAGEIDPSNARELGRQLNRAVPNDTMAVLLDMTEVHYLDSSGVQLIFEFAERLDARQQRLAVVVPEDSPARRVLEIVALDSTAPIAATRADARARLDHSAQ
jgi:anti-sigma B factor antagonist